MDALSSWVLVVDSTQPYSQQQLEVCTSLKPPLQGVEDCSAPDSNTNLCREVPHFPTFCNTGTQKCIAGLRLTDDSFRELASLPST